MIDVIIPAYNAKKTIIKTLVTVMNQTMSEDLHVYIVDDCSKDNYEDIYNLFSNYLKIDILKLNKNSGPGVARQYGIDHSNGEYIVFLDADDELYDNEAIETLYKNIEGFNLSFGLMYQESTDTTLFHEGCLHGKMYKREFLENNNIKFNNLRSHEDNAFNQLCLACAKKVNYIERIVYKYNYNEKSITNTEDKAESIKLYIESMNYLFENIEKQEYLNFYSVGIAITGIMLFCYFNYLNDKDKFEFIFSKLDFLKKMYNKYKMYVDDEDRAGVYNNFSYTNIPFISFDEFLDKIKEVELVNC